MGANTDHTRRTYHEAQTTDFQQRTLAATAGFAPCGFPATNGRNHGKTPPLRLATQPLFDNPPQAVRLFPLGELRTTEGKAVEVIQPGTHNFEAGPDFFNAQVRIDGEYWVGNIEIHTLSSDWYRHHHDTDPAYDNVILHVVERQDCAVTTENGNRPPQIEIAVPQHVRDNYQELLAEEHYPPCHRIIPLVPTEVMTEWMATLTAERLESKSLRIDDWLQRTTGDWQRTFFITLARAFGFGTNAEAFEQWAFSVRQDQVGKHRNDPLQVEAYFLGLAGLLDHLPDPKAAAPKTLGEAATMEGQAEQPKGESLQLLLREYRFLKHKFSLQPLPRQLWKLGRLRPQNFPQVRLSQLAAPPDSHGCLLPRLLSLAC